MAVSMTDKLSALRHQNYRGGSEYGHVAESEFIEGAEDINKVLTTADDVNKTISMIKKNIERMKHNHNTMLTAYNNQATKEANESLNEEIKKLSHQVHNHLKRMKSDIEGEERGPNRNSAEFRIKKAQYNTVIRVFKDVMEEYNAEQENYRDKSKDRIEKQLQYAGYSVTDDQLESMLESDDTQVFTQDLMLLTAQKRAALGECEARHQEILSLEQNIRELHNMFYDMALLVEEQGELIDRIERNVENASVFVYHGQNQISKAVVHRRSGRRVKWIICFILSGICLCLLLLGAVAAGVVVYFQNRTDTN